MSDIKEQAGSLLESVAGLGPAAALFETNLNLDNE